MSTIDERRQVINDRIEQRTEQRRVATDNRRVAREALINRGECPLLFQEKFQQSVTEVQALINSANPDTNFNDILESVSVKIEELQRYLSESTLYLPSFDSEHARKEILSLTNLMTERRDSLVPKKKFAFGSKKPASSGNISTKKGIISTSITDTQSKTPQDPVVSKCTVPVINANFECGFTDRTEEVLRLTAADLSTGGKDCQLARLTDCEVRIEGRLGALNLHALTRCRIYCGPVSGSVLAIDCQECIFQLACQQLRIHTTRDTTFCLHVTSRAIIEDCQRVRFAPYSLSYPELASDFKLSGLNPAINNWQIVDDFNHLAFGVASPNWSEVPLEEQALLAVKLT